MRLGKIPERCDSGQQHAVMRYAVDVTSHIVYSVVWVCRDGEKLSVYDGGIIMWQTHCYTESHISPAAFTSKITVKCKKMVISVHRSVVRFSVV